jgi:leucyl-tRNA synthetase
MGWDRDWSGDTSLPFDIQVTSLMLPVDFYMIGPEHIVLHLLYSRFLTKFLRDKGYLQFNEPFMKMRHQGMILGPDHKKMSKSKGNVITPDVIVEEFGADTLRMYEMFMGPLDADKPWDPRAVAGVNRFLQRYYRYVMRVMEKDLSTAKRPTDAMRARDDTLDLNSVSSVSSVSDEIQRLVHKTLKKVSEDIPNLKFNTAIAAMMEMMNGLEEGLKQGKGLGVLEIEILIKMIAPMAPYVSEELWQALQKESVVRSQESGIYSTIHLTHWPKWDPEMVESGEATLVVQVNGKTRSKLIVNSSELRAKMSQDAVMSLVGSDAGLQKWIKGKEVKKVIYVPAKLGGAGLVNVVVGE